METPSRSFDDTVTSARWRYKQYWILPIIFVGIAIILSTITVTS